MIEYLLKKISGYFRKEKKKREKGARKKS